MLEFGDEDGEFGEDVGLDVVAKELGGGGAEAVDGEAAVDGGHVAADVVLGDGAALVAFVAFFDPGDLVEGDELGVDGPVHEGGAGVAGPESAVAVEYGDLGVEGVDAGVEVWGGEAEGGAGVGQGGYLCGAGCWCHSMRAAVEVSAGPGGRRCSCLAWAGAVVLHARCPHLRIEIWGTRVLRGRREASRGAGEVLGGGEIGGDKMVGYEFIFCGWIG